MQRLFLPRPTEQTPQPQTVQLGNFATSIPFSKIPGSENYFLYIKLNDHPEMVEEGARLIAERIKKLGVVNPHFVTPEASTLALAHVLRTKYQIPGTTIYKKIQINDRDPVSIQYQPITSTEPLSLHLDKQKAAALHGKNIFIIDSICTTGETIKATYQLLLKAGIVAEQIVEATMLFNEDKDRQSLEVCRGKFLRVCRFGYLPLVSMQPVTEQATQNTVALMP